MQNPPRGVRCIIDGFHMNTPSAAETAHYTASTPRSRKLQAHAERYLPGGSSRGTAHWTPYPFFAERGEGHYVFDVDGNRYLDFMLNATSLIHGHAHPDVTRAIQEQAAKGVAFSAPTEVQARLAEMLCERVPSVELARFTSSGTEATMNAIRAARAFTGRPKIAKIEGGYHGSHDFASVSVTTPADSLDPAGPAPAAEFPGLPQGVLDNVVVLPFNDLEACERVIRRRADDLACVIMEPVVSSFGYLPAEPGFLRGIRGLTRELGVLLIFDEVQSLRTAPGGAQERLGVAPDLTAMGKIIGGGLPVGAFGGRRDLMEQFDPQREDAIPHSGTFNANPLTMAAGDAALRRLTPDAYERLDRLGGQARAKLQAVLDELEVKAVVTGIASLFAIHFGIDEVTDYRSKLQADAAMTSAVFIGLLNEGVLLQQSCAGSLSTITSESDIDTLAAAVRRVVQRTAST